jgi:asparagine synthase (glutamine-hydrolysing)
MQVSEVAARHFKVALTGLAGDEMTSGYGKHAHFYEKRAVFRVPAPIRVLLGCLAAPVAPLSGHGAALAHFYGVRDEEIYLAQKNARAIGWLRRVPGFRTWARGTFERGPQPPELAIPAFERDAVMPNVHLISADLGSMHHGLELRTPFLSRDVANTVARFDPRSLVAFGQKSVLRRILARYIPPHLTNLPKSGFSFPVDRFLESFGNDAPSVTGLAPSLVRSAWRRRFDGGGWSRIAIRMAVAARFAARTGQLRSVA